MGEVVKFASILRTYMTRV